MSEALDLLNGLTDEQIAEYSVNQSEEPHILIDNDRNIIVPESLKRIAVQYDKDIETVTFDCPRYWDEHDLFAMTLYICYKCADGYEDAFVAKNVRVSNTDSSIINFDWTVSDNVTNTDGKLIVSVCAKTVDENGNEENVWNSEPCEDMYVSKGLKTIAKILAENPDILTEVLRLHDSATNLYETARTRAGVYVGSGDVPEWADVHIDPDGEAHLDIDIPIVQEKGDNTDAVMSQKATTDEINKMAGDIARNSMRVTNLEKGLPEESFFTDSTVAYSKSVPANALPYAEVEMVGGMSYRVNVGTDDSPVYELQHSPVESVKILGSNLFGGDALADRLVEEATAIKDEAKGTVTYSVSKISSKIVYSVENKKPNTRYTILFYGVNTSSNTVNMNVVYTDGSSSPLSFGVTNEVVYCAFTTNASKTFSHIVGSWKSGTVSLYYDKCGIFEGELTEADFKPYGIRLYPVSEDIRNLDGYGWGINDSIYNYVDWENGRFVKMVEKISFDENSTFEFRSINDHGVANFLFALSNNATNGIICDKLPTQITVAADTTDAGIYMASVGIYVRLLSTTASNLEEFKTWLSQNHLEVIYRLSNPEFTVISPRVKALDGFGLSINGDVYNYVDWDKKQFVKKVRNIVFDGTEAWDKTGDSYFILYSSHAGISPKSGIGSCTHFAYGHDTFFIGEAGIAIFTNDMTSVEEFKTYLAAEYANGTPVTVTYELTEPVMTDISELLPVDTLIGVEGGGMVTMVNEFGHDVPSEITYMLKGE